MTCIECGGNMISHSDQYIYNAPFIGDIILNGFEYIQCDSKSCNNTYFMEEIAEQIDIDSGKKLDSILRSYPVDQFMTEREAKNEFKIPKQVFNKSRKLFRIKLGGIYLYFKKSLIRYAESGDGRFDIRRAGDIENPVI